MIMRASNNTPEPPYRFPLESKDPDLRYGGKWRTWTLPFGDFVGVTLENAIKDPAATDWLKRSWLKGYLRGGSFAYVDALFAAYDPEFRERHFWEAEQAAYDLECRKHGLPEGEQNPHRPGAESGDVATVYRILAALYADSPLGEGDLAWLQQRLLDSV